MNEHSASSGDQQRERQPSDFGTLKTPAGAYGDPMLWLSGGALATCLVMIIGLLLWVLVQGGSTFWPLSVYQYETLGGDTLMGELARVEQYRPEQADRNQLAAMIEDVTAVLASQDGWATRRLIRTGNFEISGEHFRWVRDLEIANRQAPDWALLVERLSWGRFYGLPLAFLEEGEAVARSPGAIWQRYQALMPEVRRIREQVREIENQEVARINYQLDAERLRMQRIRMEEGEESRAFIDAQERFQETEIWAQKQISELAGEIEALRAQIEPYAIKMTTANGQETEIALAEIVRAYPANQIGVIDSLGIYLDRWQEYLLANPREANREGGVFPAIFGTVVMTLLMSLVVAPIGVLAALYLREYTRGGLTVSVIRIAVNNLAGVPSIVYGVFGLGFFCYLIGASLDQLFFAEKLPNPTFGTGGVLWASLTLALLTLPVVIVATEEALAAVPNSMREGSFACGASQWQTIRHIVLPRALPGILTGMILAMARGAGEVAPLMLVGAVKMAPKLPIDSFFPYFHLERSFMHLGFHIYDLGFQSQNSEAAKPMVFTTTLLLISIIFALNLLTLWLRMRLRKRFEGSQF